MHNTYQKKKKKERKKIGSLPRTWAEEPGARVGEAMH
jgi:hypothetical protein